MGILTCVLPSGSGKFHVKGTSKLKSNQNISLSKKKKAPSLSASESLAQSTEVWLLLLFVLSRLVYALVCVIDHEAWGSASLGFACIFCRLALLKVIYAYSGLPPFYFLCILLKYNRVMTTRDLV